MFNLAESYYCAETLAAELLFSRSEFVVQFHFSSSLVSTPSVHAQIWSRPDMTFAVDGVKQQLSIQVWNCPRVAERDNVVQNFRVTSRLTNLVRLSWSPPKKPGVNVYLVSLTSDFVCLLKHGRWSVRPPCGAFTSTASSVLCVTSLNKTFWYFYITFL